IIKENCIKMKGIMKKYKLLLGSSTLALLFVMSGCSTSRQMAQKDDVYNTQSEARQVYQSPDYYYTDEEVQEDEYYAEEQYSDEGYYADEYSDEEYYADDGYGYEELEYANRINRFYYSSPGATYYDPWFDPWYGYSGFGLGWSSWGWGSRWSINFGFGYNPWHYGYAGMYSPYYGGLWGYNSYYSRWGHPYYGYGYGVPYYSYPRVVRNTPRTNIRNTQNTRSTRNGT